jgi:hypothetical protein
MGADVPATIGAEARQSLSSERHLLPASVAMFISGLRAVDPRLAAALAVSAERDFSAVAHAEP